MDDTKNDVMESEGQSKIPNQKELEKELSEYLSKKYGNRVKVISPLVVPRPGEDRMDDGQETRAGEKDAEFDLLPEELEAYLNGFVVKQNDAKAVLSTKICTHFNRITYYSKTAKDKKKSGVGMIKNNILMIGPTGVGKTYIIKLVAQKLGVPFVKGDATKFSETGYVGGDVEDLIRDLVYEANDDIELAENGIVYVDEIDKIASAHNLIGHDVSRTGVQRALLKPMEETEVDLKVPHDPISQIQAIEQYRRTGKKEKRVVNTRNILFIVSGAFGDLTEIIRKRLQKQGLGFEADVRSTEIPWEILKEVKAQDLIEFGFESEFVGRLPVVVVFDELKKEDLLEILQNPNNPILLSKRRDFRAYNIDIQFEDGALDEIAEMAAAEKTGARGLVSAIEKVLIPFEKTLPSTNIKYFLVTPEVVKNPVRELAILLENPGDPERISRFQEAKERELRDIQAYITVSAENLRKNSGLEMSERRIALLSELYLKNISDTTAIFEDFKTMYQQVKIEEASLPEKMEVSISFEDSAIDEIIHQAIEKDEEPGVLAYQFAKKLEYGLKLVRDRSGIEHFSISGEAIVNMEKFVNDLLKQYYHEEYSGPVPNFKVHD
jgi:ATP-dependent Clp protease ATP-binding subunit ClpX